jgi:hypothetical protein
VLATAASREEVNAKARELGAVRRSRKVEAYGLLMAFVLGLSVHGPTVLAHLHRTWCRFTGLRLARSSFWERLTVEFTQLVKWLLDAVVEQSRLRRVSPPGKLAQFRDVFALDASVVQVDDALSDHWPGTRTNSAPGAVKVHALIRVFTGELIDYQLTGERLADCKAFGVSHDLTGSLLLMDQGYSSPSLWRRIANVGGFFLTRLPMDRDPVIVVDHRPRGGRARRLDGSSLRPALRGLKRDVVDVTCTFRCTVRKYRRARNRLVIERFRVVALRNPKTGAYTAFVTNVSVARLPAQLVGRAYRLRWEVELFFKAAKSGLGLHELPSAKPHIVEALVFAALIRVSVCMQDRVAFLDRTNHPRGPDIGPQQWMKWWRQQAPLLLASLLGPGFHLSIPSIVLLLADPNRRRPTNRGVFRFWQEAA